MKFFLPFCSCMYLIAATQAGGGLVSFKLFGGCSAFLLVLKSFNDISRKLNGWLKFKWCFKDVSRKFFGCLQKIPRVFQRSLKGGSWVAKVGENLCHRSFNDVSRVFQWHFKGVSRTFQESFRELQGWFKGASRVCKRSSKVVLRVFQWSIMWILRVKGVQSIWWMFHGSFQDVLRKF